MEVHAHAHTERKKWTHYLWEFIMLFLAVFCGFLAENLREHKVENERAEQLAKNLYADVLADSANIQHIIDTRNIKERKCEYFIHYVRDSSLSDPSPAFYSAFGWATIMTRQIVFEPNDGIISQLRNSGEFRYFKNQELQSIISRLSVDIANIRTRTDNEYSFIEQILRPFTIRYFDFGWYEQITHNGKLSFLDGLNAADSNPIPAKINNLEKFDRLEAENLVSYYLLMMRGSRQAQFAAYIQDNHKLLEILRETYHIK